MKGFSLSSFVRRENRSEATFALSTSIKQLDDSEAHSTRNICEMRNKYECVHGVHLNTSAISEPALSFRC